MVSSFDHEEREGLEVLDVDGDVAVLARNYVCEGKIDKLNELLESARSEREKFDVYMAAIEGV